MSLLWLKMPELSIPDFSAWLDSKNPTVVEFCISMIGAFRQQESLPILIRLLNDPVEKRKLLAIRALRELGAAAAEQPLLTTSTLPPTARCAGRSCVPSK